MKQSGQNKATKFPKGKKRQRDTKRYAGRRSPWHTFGQWVLWILTIISIAGLLVACFAGNFEPASAKGLSFMELTLPVWLLLWVIVTVMDILWCKKALVFCILSFIACANAIWDYFPLNIFPPSAKKYADCPKFTFLTYNVASFHDLDEDVSLDYNPTVSYIIKTNADIVNLQESDITFSGPVPRLHITAEQIDTINNMYPYRLVYGSNLTVLSKYHIEPIHTPPVEIGNRPGKAYYPIGLFRLNVEGLPITLFNVHLQSYGLTDDDKTLYKNIAEGKEIAEVADGSVKEGLREIKNQLYYKVQMAAENRAEEANVLGKYIERFGGPNVIIAGDFNDVPGCYTLRRLADYKMREVYPRLGFGPMITFNADLFYFRIDHVLYRGDIVPLKITRGSLKCSDHYPLLTTFAVTGTHDSTSTQSE